MFDIEYFQSKLDSSSDKFSVIDELVTLKIQLVNSQNLTYDIALNMYNFLRKNTNAHLHYVIEKEHREKIADENVFNTAVKSFNQNSSYDERFRYITILLDKSKKDFNSQLKDILKNNMDVVENLKNIEEEQPVVVNYPIAICGTECECYGLLFKENSEFGYNLHFEHKLNYIEFQLYQDNQMVGLVDDKTFLKNFITNEF